jgi:hydrogenase maturation protease
MSWELPVRVAGCGSPAGDDAVGWEVVRRLRREWRPRAWLELYLIEGGQGLLDLLDGRGTLLLVDALAGGGEPGTIQRFEWPDRRVEVLRLGSSHAIRPAEALDLAAALGTLSSRVVVYGIEQGNLTPQAGLSPAVAAVLPDLVRRICEELDGQVPTEPNAVGTRPGKDERA